MTVAFGIGLLFFASLSAQAQGFAAPASTSGKVEYPKVTSVSGNVSIQQKGEKLAGKLPGRRLREQVLLETSKGARIRIELAPREYLLLAENSRLLIPAIDWETGKVEELELLEGSFGLELKEPRQVRADLFRDRVTEGRYIFDYSPGIPQFGVTVLQGELAFRGRETEERSVLKAGDRQVFVGEIQEGQVQYDVLLEGRKVARGRLGAKESLKTSDLSSYNKAFEALPVSRRGEKTDENGEKSVKGHSAPGKSGTVMKDAICKKPKGRFNDCAFECVNNPKGQKSCRLENPKVSCVRRRCLASGVWGDEYTYAKHLAVCGANISVRVCDY